MSESGINSLASFQRPGWIEMPSPAPTEYSPVINLLLFGVDPQTEYVLMSILAICMLKFWVKETMQTWHLYEMEQSWHTIGLRT